MSCGRDGSLFVCEPRSKDHVVDQVCARCLCACAFSSLCACTFCSLCDCALCSLCDCALCLPSLEHMLLPFACLGCSPSLLTLDRMGS